MQPAAKLSPQAEKAWSELRQHVDWSTEFALIFLFSSSTNVVDIFRVRLANLFKSKVSTLQIITPSSPQSVSEDVLETFRRPPDILAHMQAPLWLELYRDDDDALWRAARDNVLMRLNEHRELIRTRVKRPLIIVLPSAYNKRVQELAPDMWSIRNLSLSLDAPVAETREAEVSASADTETSRVKEPGRKQFYETMLAEWDRLTGKGIEGRELLTTGAIAFDAAMALRQFDRAEAVSHHLLSITREEADRNDIPSLRDVSISLDRVGDVARQRGNLDEAETAYRESLEIARQIRQATGDTPEALRDVSVSLDNVGDVARQRGNLDEAEAAFRESLEIARQIRQATVDTPDALRDVSVSLDKVGDVARQRGNLDEAETAYRESLEIRRQIRQSTGDTPEALRDLSISLNRVGDVARQRGNLDEAETAYRESLEIARQIRQATGDTPDALRDVSVSLDNVGDVARQRGNLDEAETAYKESLLLWQRLAYVLPGFEDYDKQVKRVEEALRSIRETSHSA